MCNNTTADGHDPQILYKIPNPSFTYKYLSEISKI